MLVSTKRVTYVANLGGTAEFLSAFRPIVDGRFLFVYGVQNLPTLATTTSGDVDSSYDFGGMNAG